MSNRRVLKSKSREKPLLEAIIEVGFSQDGWDVTSAGRLYERLSTRFPEKRDVQPVALVFGQAAAGLPAPIAPIVQLWTKDQSSLVQFGPGIVAVNTLNYQSWEQFSPMLGEITKPYIELIRPARLSHARTRFVNRFVFAKDEVDLSEFFTCSINLPDQLQDIDSFELNISSTLGSRERPHNMNMRFGIDPTVQQAGKTSIILDMDCSCFLDIKPTVSAVEKAADALHNSVKSLFASFVKPALRTKYGL